MSRVAVTAARARGAGVRRVGVRELSGRALERGGEEQRLPVPRRARDDLVDLRLEAHVEHPVRLVEDERADAIEAHDASVEEVLEPARRGDEHVGRLDQAGLILDRDAAVDGGDAQSARCHQGPELLGDLARQLAGRHEDERRRAAAPRDALDDRQREGERLARAGGRLGQDVMPVHDVADDERLDGERGGDALLGQGLDHGRGHAEVGEGLLHAMFTSSRHEGRERFGRIRLTRSAEKRTGEQEPRGPTIGPTSSE
jgi:hypothetical protein